MASVVAAVVTAVTSVVSTVVAAVATVAAAVTPFVGIAIGFVAGAFIGTIGVRPPNIGDIGGNVPGSGDPSSEAAGVTITRQGANQPIPIVYGYRRIGGINIFAETNGTDNKFLYAVYTLCEGEVKGAKRLLIEDQEVPLPTESDGIYQHGKEYTVTTGRFANRLVFQFFYGKDSQPQSSLANKSASWKNKKRQAPGIAYLVCRYEWKKIETIEDSNANPYSGRIPSIKVDMLGKLVRDCRQIPVGGSISSVSTKAYSFNPINCLADYLTSTVYGATIPDAKLNGDAFRIAANKLNQNITYSAGNTGKSMTMNMVITPGGKNMDIVKSILQGSRSAMPYVQGKYKVIVEDAGNATDIQSGVTNIAFDVTKEHIIGGIELEGSQKNTRYNEVRVNWIDPDKDFTSQQVIYTESGDLAADNNQKLIGEFNYPSVTNPHIALDLARLIYKKSRRGKNILFEATQELLNANVGDIITVTDTVAQLNQDTFRIVGMRLNPNGYVTVEANEHDSTIYPYTQQPIYNIAPPIYEPNDILLKPVVNTPPEFPISVYPPNDPDSTWTPGDTDSSGELVAPPPNTVLQPLVNPEIYTGDAYIGSYEVFMGDYQRTEKWLRFMDMNVDNLDASDTAYFQSLGSNVTRVGEGLLHDWRNNGQIFTGGVYDVPTVTNTETTVGIQTKYTSGLDYARYVGDQITVGDVKYPAISVKFNRPAFNTIDGALIEYYQKRDLVYQLEHELRDVSLPVTGTYTPDISRVYGGVDYNIPLIPGTVIKFYWINRQSNQKWFDTSLLASEYYYFNELWRNEATESKNSLGSNQVPNAVIRFRFTTKLFRYNYILPNGTRTTGNNIEALLNYYNDMASRGLPGVQTLTKSFTEPLG